MQANMAANNAVLELNLHQNSVCCNHFFTLPRPERAVIYINVDWAILSFIVNVQLHPVAARNHFRKPADESFVLCANSKKGI